MATTIVITMDHNSGLLAEHGGSISITKAWAKLLLNIMGWVKRKGTKAAREVPVNFDKIKEDFLKKVEEKVAENSTPTPFYGGKL